MKNLTLFLLLCVFAFSFTSCTEDITQAAPVMETPEPEVTEERYNFSLGQRQADLKFAYLNSELLPDGITYSHHLVVTEHDVLESGDLLGRGYAPVVAVAFTSNSASPTGTFSLVGEEAAENGVQSVGASIAYNFANLDYEITSDVYDSGSLTIAEEGGAFVVDVDFSGDDVRAYPIQGSYTGMIQTVNTDIQEVRADEFSGENFLSRGDEEKSLTNAYLVPYRDYYRLFLSEAPVHVGEQLVGTSDVMLLSMRSKDIKSGRYALKRFGQEQLGYFTRLRQQTLRSAYFCREMNFTENQAADDDPVDGDETLVLVEDGEISIRFSYTDDEGVVIKGEYNGPIMEASL